MIVPALLFRSILRSCSIHRKADNDRIPKPTLRLLHYGLKPRNHILLISDNRLRRLDITMDKGYTPTILGLDLAWVVASHRAPLACSHDSLRMACHLQDLAISNTNRQRPLRRLQHQLQRHNRNSKP